MALKDVLKVNRKTFIDPVAWVGYESVSDQHKTIKTILKPLFTKATPGQKETFEEAMERFNLSEEDVATGITKYHQYAMGFLALAVIALLYAFFLLFRYHTLAGWLLSVGVSAILVAQAYQYDFWSFQMRKRTLGLTFNQYKNDLFGE